MKIIEAEGINKFFGTGQNRVHVLKDMSFAIEEGDFVAIIDSPDRASRRS